MRLRYLLLSLLLIWLSSCTKGHRQQHQQAVVEAGEAETVTSESTVPVIRFSGEIDPDSAQALIKTMSDVEAAGAKTIVLELNTDGGRVDSAFLINKAIEDSGVPVVCVVDGHAQSMGFYLLQSCGTRIMTRRSVLMAHNIYYPTFQGQLDLGRIQILMKELVADNLAASEHECRHLKTSLARCRRRIGNTWVMAWQEALAMGAVQEVVGSVEEVIHRYRGQIQN